MTAPIEIFRAGTHTDVAGRTLTFAVADLIATATAYDPAVHQAPLVVGHPALDAPAYGWVQALAVTDDRLQAVPDQVEPQFAALVRAGRFKKISASFWLPDAPTNPTPGVYALRHVGFLGAAAPAIPGLRAPQFAADEADTITVDFALPSSKEPSSMTDLPVTPTNPTNPADPVADPLAAREAELTRREAALAQAEAALAQAEAARARTEAAAYADRHVQSGQLLPRQQAGLVELLLALPAAPLAFADGTGQTVQIGPRAWLEQLIADLPPRVDYAERTAPDPRARPAPAVLRRAAFEALSPAARKDHLAQGGRITD